MDDFNDAFKKFKQFYNVEPGFQDGGSVETPKRGLVDESGSYAGKLNITKSDLLELSKDFTESEAARKLGISKSSINKYAKEFEVKFKNFPEKIEGIRRGKTFTEFEGMFGVRASKRGSADNIPGASKFTDEVVYFKTEKDAKNFLKNKDKYKKAPLKSGFTKADDPAKLKKIDSYIKNFEKRFNRKPTAKNVVSNLEGASNGQLKEYQKQYQKLPKGNAVRVTNVQKDVVKILENPNIIKKLNEGKFPTITDISRITKLDPALSETRLVDIAEKLKENPKYKKIAEDYLDKPGITKTSEAFGGRKRARSRAILENRFSRLMDLDRKLPTLRADILRKIQSFLPETKGVLAVDEIGGITTSMRRGSGPYAIFGQVLGNDFNTNVKGHGVDKLKGFMEKKLVGLEKNDPQRIELQKRYNSSITDFEDKANKNNPAKKVKGLKLSFESPSKTIKNKKIYNQYKDLFDTHYDTYGYSFEVPADRDSLVDISKKLDNKSFQNIVKNRFKNLVGKGGKLGLGIGLATLAGTGFALADDALAADGTEATSVLPTAAGAGAGAAAVGTKTGRSILGKIFRGAGTPLAGLGFAATNVASKMGEGQSLADAVVDPLTGLELSFPGLFRENISKITKSPTLQKVLGLGRFGRALTPVGLGLAAAGQAQEFYNQYQDLQKMKEQNPRAYSEFMSTRQAPELSSAEQTAIEDMGRSGAAGGGLLKQAGDRSGPALQSGPTPQGLDYLLKRGRQY